MVITCWLSNILTLLSWAHTGPDSWSLWLGRVLCLVLTNNCEKKYYVSLLGQSFNVQCKTCQNSLAVAMIHTNVQNDGPFHQPVPGFLSLLNFSWFNIFSHFWKPLVSSYSNIGSASLSLLHVTTKDMYRVFLQQMFTIVKNEKQHQNSSIRGSLKWIIFIQWNIT